MTAQAPESIEIDGGSHALCSEPLSMYNALGGGLPEFEGLWSTAIRRGYLGTWEIKGDRLYLIAIKALRKSGRFETADEILSGGYADLGELFPGYPNRVFAHWYSGTLRIPQGKEIEYVHAGFASEFERDLLIQVERGVVTNTSIRHNGEAPEDAPDSYRVAAWWTP